MEEITQAAPAAVGALAGGGGVIWFAKMAFRRMILQYDKRHDQAQTDITALRKELADSEKNVAVLQAMFAEVKTMRVEVQGALSKLEGELNTRLTATTENLDELRADLFVAHERLRLLASGDNDLSKIQKPQIVKRRL